jgi:medium-chain acyl-[acyl-carrier-protein] hydrolase
MQQGYFEKEFTLTPDYCDARAGLSPLGAFTIFQAIATEHAEKIGVGGAAMAKRGEFWLTVHSRIDFLGSARLMQTLTAKTWPEGCDEKSIRCFRSYSLRCGDALVAMGRTQWAILGPEQKVVPFGQSGFPREFPFTGEVAISDAPTRFRDDFTPDDFARNYTVRPTDIDFGRHMNNVAYIRVLLDCFSAKQIASGTISSIEAHYASPCLEGETLSVYQKQDGDTVRIAIKKPDGKPAVLAAVRFTA